MRYFQLNTPSNYCCKHYRHFANHYRQNQQVKTYDSNQNQPTEQHSFVVKTIGT